MALTLRLFILSYYAMMTSASSCQNGSCQQLYTLLSTDTAIDANDVSQVVTSSTRQHCAVLCTSRDWCKSYTVDPIGAERVSCSLTSQASPMTSTRTGSSLYGVAPHLSADCTDPQLDNSSLYTCNQAPTFEAAAMLRMGSNRAILFTTDNRYIKCSSMTNIVEQGAEYCNSKIDVLGDPNIDPEADRFASGPPDGAVGYIRSNMAECRYYLFKDDLVFCYRHMDNEPWMTPCSSWTSKTIQERFGEGIPSNIDDVFGNFDGNHDFYFIKGNQVYLSRGDTAAGSLVPGFPKHVHYYNPNFICDVTAVQLGLNPGDVYYARGKHIYKETEDVVYYKKFLCN